MDERITVIKSNIRALGLLTITIFSIGLTITLVSVAEGVMLHFLKPYTSALISSDDPIVTEINSAMNIVFAYNISGVIFCITGIFVATKMITYKKWAIYVFHGLCAICIVGLVTTAFQNLNHFISYDPNHPNNTFQLDLDFVKYSMMKFNVIVRLLILLGISLIVTKVNLKLRRSEYQNVLES
ncbi:hypothetical protein BFP72_11170 [Reichenbachiella sp. 5M10]|nr:hypothetical protein BFP72_11170 [Reichenbachiella sp. 5M10]